MNIKFLFEGKLTKEETIFQEKSRLSVIWDYVKAAGGCGSVLIVIFCIALYAFGMAFASYWVSRWLEAGSGVRTPFIMFPYIFKHLYIQTKYLHIQSLNYAV